MSEDNLKILSINTPGFETKKKKEEYGIWELPPKYEYGAYNSVLCGARQGEIELAETRRQRKPRETQAETLDKLKPIYEEILVQRKEEEELAKLPVKEREKERKKRQDKRSVSMIKDTSNPTEYIDLGKPPDKTENKDEKPADDKKDQKPDLSASAVKDGKDMKDSVVESKVDDQAKKDEEKLEPSNLPKSIVNLDKAEGAVEEKIQTMKSKEELGVEEIKDDEEIYTIIDTVFSFKKDLKFLNLKFFSRYRKEGGFKFIIDGIHNIPKKGFYVTSYTLNPPAVYYTKQVKEDISVYSNFDWDKSTLKTTFYNEGYVKFKEIEFNPSLCFLIELCSVDIPAFTDPEITQKAWTILPLFTIDPLSGQGYVNSNIYQLPLFEGAMTKDIAETIQNGDPWEKVMGMVKAKKLKYWSQSSVYCRLLDIQRDGHFQKFFDYERASEEYIPENKLKDYRFLASDEERIAKKKASWLRDAIPYKEDPYNFNKRLTEICSKHFGTYVEQN